MSRDSASDVSGPVALITGWSGDDGGMLTTSSRTTVISGLVAAVVCFTLTWGWVAVSMVGVPYGIWLGMAIALLMIVPIFVSEALAAGMLLRRYGQMQAMIVPYLELTIPSMLTVVLVNAAVFRLATTRSIPWSNLLYLIPLFVTAGISVLRAWHWLVRVLLHVVWLSSLWVVATKYVS